MLFTLYLKMSIVLKLTTSYLNLTETTHVLAIPKLMSGLETSIKKCPNEEMNQITKKTTSKLVSIYTKFEDVYMNILRIISFRKS
jgi:hypothetical protein